MDPRTQQPDRATKRGSAGCLWIAAVAMLLAGVGAAGVGVAAWTWRRETAAPAPRRSFEIAPEEVHTDVPAAPVEPPPAEPPLAAVVDSPAPPAEVEIEQPPDARRVRTRRVAPVARAPEITAPAPSVSSAPAPPAQPPSGGPPAGVREATEHMGRQDWRGCIRVARASPRSPEILGARMSCSLQANDTAELRATCAELRAHYPTHGYTRACEQMLATRGG